MLSLAHFLFLLSVLVIVHEFGHFIAAKSLGVRVEKFSFGFGPRLLSVKFGETEYIISLIPLGGYVKMAGDEPGEALTNQRWEFLSRSVRDRFRIIFAGPLLNYALAFLIFSVIFMFGSPTLTTEVGGLLKDYPAQRQGILAGDEITSVDGVSVKFWEDMTRIIHAHGEGPMRLSIKRQDKTLEVEISPIARRTKDIFGREVKISLIGIMPSQRIEKIRYGFFQSLAMGLKKLTSLTVITYKALGSILIGRLSLKESLTGPIGIFVITAQASRLGIIYIFHLMAVLSASLAIFNLLPLPVLDGGHILFLIIEKIRGRPLPARTQEFIANMGIALLILLTVFILYNDIIKFGIAEKTIGFFKK